VSLPTDIPSQSTPLPWQSDVWTRLNEQLAADQLPHALLITGPEYTGKSRLALALARLLLCARPVEGLACGACHSCELSASGNHGDLRWLEPEGKGQIIKIDQVRGLVEFTNRTASFGLRKVAIISPAERMNTNAANALLKVLEEPPANTYLVLVCHRLHGLPATIRSRCQLLKPPFPPVEASLNWLDSLCGGRQESERLLALAAQRPLLAAQLYGQAGGEHLQLVQQAIKEVFAGRAGLGVLSAALAEDELGPALAQLTQGIQLLLRNLDRQRLTSAQARLGFGLLDEIAQTQRAIAGGSNPNPQLLLDALLGKVQRMLGDGGLGDNIGRNTRGVSS